MEGISNQVSIIKESSWGTAGVPDKSIPIKPSDGIQIEQEVIGIEAIKTTAPKNKLFSKGKVGYNGTFDMDFYPSWVAWFLYSALGSDTPSTTESGVYNHTMIEAVAKPSLTIEQVVGTVTKRFAGFIVKSFKIAGKVGETITLSVNGMAKTQTSETKISASYDTVKPFTFENVTSLTVGGTDIKAKLEEFSIEYDNGLEMFTGFGSVEPSAKYVKQSEVKGSLKLYLDATTDDYIADLLANTEREIILTITGTTLIGATQYNKLVVTLSKCVFTKTVTPLGFEYNAVEADFSAREDATNGLIKLALQNAIATL